MAGRVTLTIVVLVAIIVAPVGLAIGTAAGYFGGLIDTVLMRITDIFLAFPRLILALAFVAALGPGIENAVIAIALTAWPPYARRGARRDHDLARERFHQRGAAAGRLLLAHLCAATSCRCAFPR